MTTALTTTTTNAIVAAGSNDADVVTMWINKVNRSANTSAQYNRVARSFFAYVGKPLSAITYNDLDAWVQSLEGAPATIKAKVAAVKSLFSFAAKLGYLALNPAAIVEPPRVADRKHRKVASEEAIIKLVNAAGSARDEAILRTLYSSGCRVSELCSLTWSDVVPTEDGKANLRIVGKGNKERTAGISAATYSALLNIRPMVGDPALPVFLSNRGQAMDRTVIHRMIEKVGAKVGVKLSAHWFRHSHATHALKRGANVVDVQEQLGHSSLAVTTGYAHRQHSSADSLAI
jgi:site-specific recombinase XerD